VGRVRGGNGSDPAGGKKGSKVREGKSLLKEGKRVWEMVEKLMRQRWIRKRGSMPS